jgi:NADH-quinone oxidoreductase subunit N
VEQVLTGKLDSIQQSFAFFLPEIILSIGILFILIMGIVFRIRENKTDSDKSSDYRHAYSIVSIIILFASAAAMLTQWSTLIKPETLFVEMIRVDQFSTFLKIIIEASTIVVVLLTWRGKLQTKLSEYYALVLAVVLGAHLLMMSVNFIMLFLSLEIISISSYVLTGFLFNKKASEASLKYFLFGSIASAIMLYGLSILFGLTGSLDFTSSSFSTVLMEKSSPLMFTALLLTLAGFLYKIAAAPMHIWSPDIYEAAPMPIVAFFSIVPKLAGFGILTKFLLSINVINKSAYDWQLIISAIAIITITIGNFSALQQKNAKRMMAYSSIAQSGFLLIGLAASLPSGIHFMLFYAVVYAVGNMVVFLFLQYFESNSIHTIAEFKGVGKQFVWPSILLFVALISLTGLPPTSGFSAKLFIFSSLWEAYSISGKPVLLVLFVFGLLNTVISLFYYLRIPYYAFLKDTEGTFKQHNLTFENLFGFILVLVILILFFLPGMLMGWINKITFVL